MLIQQQKPPETSTAETEARIVQCSSPQIGLLAKRSTQTARNASVNFQ